MTAYVIYDVEIRDPQRYQDFMMQAQPAIEAAGGRYLARGGEHKVIEGDWHPHRIVLFQFPSMEQAEQFYHSDFYQNCKAIRDECSTGHVVLVQGIASAID